MAENPFQSLLVNFGKLTNCIQTHLSNFISHPPSPTAEKPLISLSSSSSKPNSSSADSTVIQSKVVLTKSMNGVTEEVYRLLGQLNPFSEFASDESSFSVEKSNAPVTKEELGRATWTFLHTLAAQYPDNPTRQQKKDVKELMSILSRMYPCKECADHFKEILRANPVEAGSQADFSQWLCHVHNVVNRSLGKVVFPCSRVDARWGKLDCEQRACDLQGNTNLGK